MFVAKINIIISALNSDLYSTKRLISEAQKLKYSVSYLNPYQFLIPMIPKKARGHYFHRTTGTNYDDFDLIVTKHHEISGFSVTNPLERLKLFRSKDAQSLFFNEHQIPGIKTLLYRGKLTESLEEELLALSIHQKYILKMTRGNQGIGVNILESHKSLVALLETFHAMRDQRFLIQPYIPHKKEWRALFIRGEMIACIEKTISKEDFRGNAKRSNAKLLKKIPRQLEKIAHYTYSQSGLEYAGIDLLETNNSEILVLEVNAIPGFEQAEELSGHNIARELVANLE